MKGLREDGGWVDGYTKAEYTIVIPRIQQKSAQENVKRRSAMWRRDGGEEG